MDSISGFTQINVYSLNDNIFHLLDNQWMLITSGTPEKFNPMTASWGGFGILWNKPIALVFIRPQRFTYQLVEKNPGFTLSFFDDDYKSALNICGSKSGRDVNKPKEAGLTPALTPSGSIAFKESRLILDCKKLYADNLKPDSFIDQSIISRNYPSADFHRFFIGEIIGCYEKGE